MRRLLGGEKGKKIYSRRAHGATVVIALVECSQFVALSSP
jgi:hypothetical protein